MSAMIRTLFDHVVAGELRPGKSTQYELADFVAAFDSVVARKSVGRVVLEI